MCATTDTISVGVIVIGLITLAIRELRLGWFSSMSFEDSEVKWYASFVEKTRARTGIASFAQKHADGGDDKEVGAAPPADDPLLKHR